MARFLEPAEVGLYGLLLATVTYAIYPLGIDFYNFTSRELAKSPRRGWAKILKNHGIVLVALYATVGPALLLIFSAELLPWSLVGWFYAILALEHIAQELTRALIALNDQVWAAVTQFVRLASWGLAAVPILLFAPGARSLETVLLLWAIGVFAATALGLARLHRIGALVWVRGLDLRWIAQGVTVALPMLVGTLALRALFTIDRFAIDAYLGATALGAYVFFFGLASTLTAFFEAGVFVFHYPDLVRAFHAQEHAQYRAVFRRMAIQTLALAALAIPIALIAIRPVIGITQQDVYAQYEWMFPWLLAVVLVYNIGLIWHFGLYSQDRDAHIVASHVAALGTFGASIYFIGDAAGSLTVPISLVAAFVVILGWKALSFRMPPYEAQRSG